MFILSYFKLYVRQLMHTVHVLGMLVINITVLLLLLLLSLKKEGMVRCETRKISTCQIMSRELYR